LAEQGWHLQPRLPIYPQFDAGLPSPLAEQVQHWRERLAQGTLLTNCRS
jgi:7,8-didemethyl-8-hydroxy-5-deazariboflavin synthase